MRTTDVENTSPPEVDPQAFASFTTSLFGSHRPYSDTKVFNLVAWIFYLHELFRVEPDISSFRGTDFTTAWFSLIG